MAKLTFWEGKGVHDFPKGICPKVNIIVLLEFEFVYYDLAVQCFNHEDTPKYLDLVWFDFYI